MTWDQTCALEIQLLTVDSVKKLDSSRQLWVGQSLQMIGCQDIGVSTNTVTLDNGRTFCHKHLCCILDADSYPRLLKQTEKAMAAAGPMAKLRGMLFIEVRKELAHRFSKPIPTKHFFKGLQLQ